MPPIVGLVKDLDQWFYARVLELGESTHLSGAVVAYAAAPANEEPAA